MTREQFCAVLDKLQDHTKYIYYHLMGEPLMHLAAAQSEKVLKDAVLQKSFAGGADTHSGL